jgi:hypothetical protein
MVRSSVTVGLGPFCAVTGAVRLPAAIIPLNAIQVNLRIAGLLAAHWRWPM